LRCEASTGHTEREEKDMSTTRKILTEFTTKKGFRPKGHEQDLATEAPMRELQLRTECQAVVSINHQTDRGENSSRAQLHAGAISSWMEREDCPLNFDIVIPDGELKRGLPMEQYLPTFLCRREYKKGVHYHRLKDVGVVFHVKSALGTASSDEYGCEEDFILPETLLSRKMTRQCAWTEHWKLQFHAKTVVEYVTETRRHTVRRGDADEEVAELILTPAERNVSWTVDQIKARCSELYGKAPHELGLNAGRRGTQPSDKPGWCREIKRLYGLPELQAHVSIDRYVGSAPALACSEPDWPTALQSVVYSKEPGKTIRDVALEAQRRAEEALEKQAKLAERAAAKAAKKAADDAKKAAERERKRQVAQVARDAKAAEQAAKAAEKAAQKAAATARKDAEKAVATARKEAKKAANLARKQAEAETKRRKDTEVAAARKRAKVTKTMPQRRKAAAPKRKAAKATKAPVKRKRPVYDGGGGVEPKSATAKSYARPGGRSRRGIAEVLKCKCGTCGARNVTCVSAGNVAAVGYK
jgi:hypothetical protein